MQGECIFMYVAWNKTWADASVRHIFYKFGMLWRDTRLMWSRHEYFSSTKSCQNGFLFLADMQPECTFKAWLGIKNQNSLIILKVLQDILGFPFIYFSLKRIITVLHNVKFWKHFFVQQQNKMMLSQQLFHHREVVIPALAWITMLLMKRS